MEKDLTRLVVDIDPEIKKKFRVKTMTEGLTMRDKVIAMIAGYLASQD